MNKRDLATVLARLENARAAFEDIARQPEGDEQSAQAVAREALRTIWNRRATAISGLLKTAHWLRNDNEFVVVSRAALQNVVRESGAEVPEWLEVK